VTAVNSVQRAAEHHIELGHAESRSRVRVHVVVAAGRSTGQSCVSEKRDGSGKGKVHLATSCFIQFEAGRTQRKQVASNKFHADQHRRNYFGSISTRHQTRGMCVSLVTVTSTKKAKTIM
jgi:hypothetical protein